MIGDVEIGDDTVHPIEHIGRVPLVMQDGKFKHLEDVLHVPTPHQEPCVCRSNG